MSEFNCEVCGRRLHWPFNHKCGRKALKSYEKRLAAIDSEPDEPDFDKRLEFAEQLKREDD